MRKEIKAKPLASFPLVSTSSVEEAEWKLGNSLAPCRIEKVAAPRNFHLTLNGVSFNRASLVYNHYGCEAEVEAETPAQSVSFIIGGEVPTRFDLNDGSYWVGKDDAVLVTKIERMRIHRHADSELFVLRASAADLREQFETLADRHLRGSLAFDRQIKLAEGAGRALGRLMLMLSSELEDNEFVLNHAALRRSYDDTLLTALLSLPHDHGDVLSEGHPRVPKVAPAVVRRAEEYMRASLGEVVTIADLVRLCGCSRRALSAAFRSTRGYSPMEFLTEQRLLAAQRRLRQQRGGDTVSAIALDCGFGHLGRFSQSYRLRFGELPSETLRRSRDR